MVYEGDQKLGDFFSSRREKGRAGLPTVSVTLTRGLIDRSSLDRKTDTNLDEDEHLLVRKGDLVYNMMRMWQGASGLAEKDSIVSPAYIVLSPKNDVDPLYASYLFKTQRLIYLFWAYSYGLTSDRLRLYFPDFSIIPVNVPSVESQARIANIISTWSKAIDLTEKLIRNSQAQKKAIMQQLLTGKVRLTKFPEEWEPFQIGDMGKIVSGGTPDTGDSEYWDGSIPWATPSDIVGLRNRHIKNTIRKISKKGVSNSSASILPKGTLLICTRATIGYLAISTAEITTNQGFKNLIPKKNFDVDFLNYLFIFFRNKFIRYACGSTFLELSKKDFSRLRFDCPKLDEQKRIASILGSIDQVISLKYKVLDELVVEKKSLMQQLLTGKRSVKVDESAKEAN
ncbi:MAG: restriction endonuclease subunit S [Pseudomonadales bacterium]|nr:restriction endonuclease subunit S [Pseudomonadales bacterium]